MAALTAIRPAEVGGEVKVFGLPECQIARRVKAVAGLENWEPFSGHSDRVSMVGRYARGESAGDRRQ